jgi:hypothetical protein
MAQDRAICDCVASTSCCYLACNVEFAKLRLDSCSLVASLLVDALDMFDKIIEECNFEVVPECTKICKLILTKSSVKV